MFECLRSVRFAVLFLLASSVLSGCRENANDEPIVPDAPIKTTLLKVKFDESNKTSATDNWVILYNSAGELIDMKPVESGETLTFEKEGKSLDTKMSVSFFSYTKSPIENFQVRTYLDVSGGREWTYYYDYVPRGDAPVQLGYFKTTITNVPSIFSASISDRYGSTFSNNVSGGNAVNFALVLLRPNETKHFVFIDDGNTAPRYRWVENPKVNDIHTFDFNTDFKPFDKFRTVSLPGRERLGVVVIGFNDAPTFGNGYITSYIFNFPLKADSEVKLGFLDSFAQYLVSVSYDGFEYYSLGPVPASIDYVSPSQFKLTNKTIPGFGFSTTTPYVSRETRFTFEDVSMNMGVTYYAPVGQFLHPPVLPTDLVSKYPNFKPDKFMFAYSVFHVQGDIYHDRIESEFSKPPVYYKLGKRASVQVLE